VSGEKPVTRADHRTFCEHEGWDEAKRAAGGSVSHHLTYEFPHPDGRTLRTRISRPVKPEPYGKNMAAHILRDQLEVTVEEFWACAEDNVAPERGIPAPEVETIPLGLLIVLRDQLHLGEDELKGLSKEEAIRRASEFWSRPPE
jgi:hypothetical protein